MSFPHAAQRLAGPHGMQLFDRWCTDDKNSVLIPGYSVEGTLAKKIQSSPDEVTGMDGRVRHLNCAIEYISFSAHVDFVQNKNFIDGVEVRMEASECGAHRLERGSLVSLQRFKP